MSAGEVDALFRRAYGRAPVAIASAPGRVNLIGEHTDYNGGEVLPIAIAQRTWVAMAPATGTTSHAVSRERADAGEWTAAYARASGAWWDYLVGAFTTASSLGLRTRDHLVAVVSDVPMGAGLSSSAALEVATIAAALAMEGVPVDDGVGERAVRWQQVAVAAHLAETGFVGVPCGIMDQFASALCRRGHALHLRCDTADYRHVPFDRGILIVDTMSPRALRTSAFNARRDECRAALEILRRHEPSLESLAHATPELLERAALPEPEARRARHVVSETGRVREFVARCADVADVADVADATGASDGEALGRLLNASHRSLRLDYECTSPELDWVVEHSVARVGIDGARMTGAGWGGCAIVVGHPDALADFAPELSETFEMSWGRPPRTWLTEPSEGARIDA